MTTIPPIPPLTKEEELAAKMSSLDWQRFNSRPGSVSTDYSDQAIAIVKEFCNHHGIDRKEIRVAPAFVQGRYTKDPATILLEASAVTAAKQKGLDLLDFADRSPSVNPPTFMR